MRDRSLPHWMWTGKKERTVRYESRFLHGQLGAWADIDCTKITNRGTDSFWREDDSFHLQTAAFEFSACDGDQWIVSQYLVLFFLCCKTISVAGYVSPRIETCHSIP